MQAHILRNLLEVKQWQDNHLSFDEKLLEKHRPASHIVVADKKEVYARCSLWISNLCLNQKRIGVIGHYAASHDEAAKRVLEAACAWLYENNCEVVIGPMDGNTWRNYRFVIEAGDHAPFFLEPQNPMCYPRQFIEAGFHTVAPYSSILCNNLRASQTHLNKVEKRMADGGVTIRCLRLEQWEKELQHIYRVSSKAFVRNFLYEPVDESEFLATYQNIKNIVYPELVLLAEYEGEAVGFSFSYPDFLQKQRNEEMNRIVVKTVAVLPQRRFAGLGNLLAEKTHGIAQKIGFNSAIHALIHDGNVSRNVSTRYGETMRRYALFARDLTP